jgi:outer membrane receptor protein involved in Fe transport
LPNTAIAGAAFDAGDTRYVSEQLAGYLGSDRMVVSSGQVIGGSGNYVAFTSRNRYTGLFGTDSLTVLPGVVVTVAARYNIAHIEMRDQYGNALTANHNYDRLNPSAGVTWKVLPQTTVFLNYSEANRVPTPAELSCADSSKPCFVPNGFQADPNLGQVTSRSWESGLRGKVDWGDFSGHWSTTAFHTDNANDIYFVADPNITGSGYFRNIGGTERNGFEGNLDGRIGKATLFASYTLLRATFDSPMFIGSRSPAASGNNQIYVTPGKVMPGIPLHSLKFGGAYEICQDVTIGGDAIVKSGVYLRGDENNTQPMTNPYAVFNMDVNWKATDWMSVYVRLNNLFNQKYETAGQYGDASNVFANYSTNDRFLTTGMPFNAWLGTRVVF